jgi:hypothetical protein
MTGEQARQLKAVYEALIVPGTTNPNQTVDLLFSRVRNIEHAMIVPGTTTAEEAFDLLFARVRNIEHIVEGLQPAAAGTAQIDYDLLADKVAERLAREPPEPAEE